jgi:hypothetical protein
MEYRTEIPKVRKLVGKRVHRKVLLSVDSMVSLLVNNLAL